MKYQRIKGTADILPPESERWAYLERVVREVMQRYNYQEIRVPIFEMTELFARGIGEATDIVNKEMYTFNDMGGRSVTLRPEATASAVRSYIEESLGKQKPLVKLFYIGPMFRQEKPQKGRQRQFHQFGAEAIGSNNPAVDAELIALSVEILKSLGVNDFTVWINSVGTPKIRARHREKLLEFVKPVVDKFPKVDREKIDRNPLRLFDSKEAETQKLLEGAPVLMDFLDDDCRRDYEKVQEILSQIGIGHKIDPRLVRGLDYYTRTAYEIKSDVLGAQDSLLGGGRYDLLVEELGGDPTPAMGFAAGMERILLAMKEAHSEKRLTLFIVAREDSERAEAIRLAQIFREQGIIVDLDYLGRSQKSQMKEADRQKARFVLFVFADRVLSGTYQLKSLDTSEQQELSLDEILKRLKHTRLTEVATSSGEELIPRKMLEQFSEAELTELRRLLLEVISGHHTSGTGNKETN
jgi:histidyl-tRNA synthetase